MLKRWPLIIWAAMDDLFFLSSGVATMCLNYPVCIRDMFFVRPSGDMSLKCDAISSFILSLSWSWFASAMLIFGFKLLSRPPSETANFASSVRVPVAPVCYLNSLCLFSLAASVIWSFTLTWIFGLFLAFASLWGAALSLLYLLSSCFSF